MTDAESDQGNVYYTLKCLLFCNNAVSMHEMVFGYFDFELLLLARILCLKIFSHI